jgi:hypothetical protein
MAPELRFMGRAIIRGIAGICRIAGQENMFARRVISINDSAVNRSIPIVRYDKNGLVAE